MSGCDYRPFSYPQSRPSSPSMERSSRNRHSRESVERFCTWVPLSAEHAQAYWLRYVSNFEAGLEAAAVEQAEIADEWSTVDSDGLNNAA